PRTALAVHEDPLSVRGDARRDDRVMMGDHSDRLRHVVEDRVEPRDHVAIRRDAWVYITQVGSGGELLESRAVPLDPEQVGRGGTGLGVYESDPRRGTS